eukprot:Opistho-2@61203
MSSRWHSQPHAACSSLLNAAMQSSTKRINWTTNASFASFVNFALLACIVGSTFFFSIADAQRGTLTVTLGQASISQSDCNDATLGYTPCDPYFDISFGVDGAQVASCEASSSDYIKKPANPFNASTFSCSGTIPLSLDSTTSKITITVSATDYDSSSFLNSDDPIGSGSATGLAVPTSALRLTFGSSSWVNLKISFSCATGTSGSTCDTCSPACAPNYGCVQDARKCAPLSCAGLTVGANNSTKCEYPCPEGKYGLGCLGTCNCKNGALCNRANGTCECTPGWMGQWCDIPCSQNTFGFGCSRCQSCNSECDQFTGCCGSSCSRSCTSSLCGTNSAGCDAYQMCMCTAGWTGTPCTVPCPVGTYGPRCVYKCQCKNGATCDAAVGCKCVAGWFGRNCDVPCPT